MLTRAGGGGGGVEGAPTPVGAAARSATGSGGSGVGGGSTVSSPTAIGSPGMSSSAGGGGGEESAFSALEPLVCTSSFETLFFVAVAVPGVANVAVVKCCCYRG